MQRLIGILCVMIVTCSTAFAQDKTKEASDKVSTSQRKIPPNSTIAGDTEQVLAEMAKKKKLSSGRLGLGEAPNRREPVLSAVEIARRWDAVARFGDWLAAQDDEDARAGAAVEWQFDQALPGSGDFGGSAGPGGTSGIGQGAANLQLLKGLTEGLQKLRS